MRMQNIQQIKAALPPFQSTLVLKKESNSEFSTSCPKCHGTDRFRVWPDNARFWCRVCNWKGDIIDYYCFIEKTNIAGLIKKYLPSDRQIKKPVRKKKFIKPQTPDALWNKFIIDNLQPSDITSGFFARFLLFYPPQKKKIPPAWQQLLK